MRSQVPVLACDRFLFCNGLFRITSGIKHNSACETRKTLELCALTASRRHASPRTQTDNSCVPRSRTSQTPRKLPPRTSRTYKIPNAYPKGMLPHEQYKNVLNKNERDLSGSVNKFPTTLNTTAKHKAQDDTKQRRIKNAARRITIVKVPERSEW